MQIDISYEEAQARYPLQVADIIKQLRKGKSIQKNVDPSALQYRLDWAIQVQAFSFGQILQGAHQTTPKPSNWAEYWADIKPRLRVCLRAQIKRWWGYSTTTITSAPHELESFYRTCYEKEAVDTARQTG